MTDTTEATAKAYDEGYQAGWIEAKADYEKRLRDEFAMAALQGLLSDPTLDMIYHETASLAYGYADAMMKARREVPE